MKNKFWATVNMPNGMPIIGIESECTALAKMEYRYKYIEEYIPKR